MDACRGTPGATARRADAGARPRLPLRRQLLPGQLYAALTQFATGVWIYPDLDPTETVKETAEAFERRDPEETIRDFWTNRRPIYDHRAAEVRARTESR